MEFFKHCATHLTQWNVASFEALGDQVDLVVAIVDLLDLHDDVVARLAHEVAGAGDLRQLHIVLLHDSLAEACLSRCLVQQLTRLAVHVALAIDLHRVVVLQHVLRSALPGKVFIT